MKLLKRPTDYRTMDQIRSNIPGFFTEESMSAFNTVIPDDRVSAGGLFVTGEEVSGTRAWTVRRAFDIYQQDRNKFLPVILNVAEGFAAYDTEATARDAMKRYAHILGQSGQALLGAMSDAVGGAKGFCAMTSMRGGATLIATDEVHGLTGAMARKDPTNLDGDDFDCQLIRVDFVHANELRKVLRAGMKPVAEEWVEQLMAKANAN